MEEEEIWADSHTSDDFTLLTAVGLIVTSPKKEYISIFGATATGARGDRRGMTFTPQSSRTLVATTRPGALQDSDVADCSASCECPFDN